MAWHARAWPTRVARVVRAALPLPLRDEDVGVHPIALPRQEKVRHAARVLHRQVPPVEALAVKRPHRQRALVSVAILDHGRAAAVVLHRRDVEPDDCTVLAEHVSKDEHVGRRIDVADVHAQVRLWVVGTRRHWV